MGLITDSDDISGITTNNANTTATMMDPISSGAAATGDTSSIAASGKKAVHVKWAGKTIALGTFLAAEAEEKCARAKALTRAWRSTMRPKPSREWVMLELERLQVRIVSGRMGRRGEDDDEEGDEGSEGSDWRQRGRGYAGDTAASSTAAMLMGGMGMMGSMTGMNSGLGIMNNSANSSSSVGLMSSSINNNYRPFVGGAAAAAYEAARADHYNSNIKNTTSANTVGGSLGGNNVMGLRGDAFLSSGLGSSGATSGGNSGMMALNALSNNMLGDGLGAGSMGSNISVGNLGMPVNANQHYEMLKLHHMNLLNEIQETTLMMNLYQQQMLQQGSGMNNVANGGGGGGSQRNSLGGNMGMMNLGMGVLGGYGGGGNATGNSNVPQAIMGMRNHSLQSSSNSSNINIIQDSMGNFDRQGSIGSRSASGGCGSIGINPTTDEERTKLLQELKEDISRQVREAAQLEASLEASLLDPSKRKSDVFDEGLNATKRAKTEDDSDVDDDDDDDVTEI